MMLLPRLGFLSANVCKINRTNFLLWQRCMSQKSIDHDLDKPIPYRTSQAADWKAAHTRSPPSDMVWYTPYVVSASMAIFMIYFCILREENDLDQIIYRPLPETLEGIDKQFPNFDFYTKPDYVRFYEDRTNKKAK